MKIICIGRNYADHASELKNEVPTQPVIFLKPDTAYLKNNATFYLPDFSKEIHYECELIFRICKEGKHIAEKFAHKYIDKISVGIDFTARDVQEYCKQKALPWERAKAFDHSAVCGDWLELKTIEKINEIDFSLTKNKNIVQKGNSGNMLFSIQKIIAEISTFITLKQGDILFTGTPSGVGRVAIGDILEGYLNNQKLLHCIVA